MRTKEHLPYLENPGIDLSVEEYNKQLLEMVNHETWVCKYRPNSLSHILNHSSDSNIKSHTSKNIHEKERRVS